MTHLYQSVTSLNVFETAECRRLSTQLWEGRYFFTKTAAPDGESGVSIVSLEDGYSGFIPANVMGDCQQVQPVEVVPNHDSELTAAALQASIPAVLAIAADYAGQPNHYLWGGSVGPNFDCSGLVQRCFATQGIWLPRDSYQQAEFVDCICDGALLAESVTSLQAGDTIFFQMGRRIDHVALYWGDGRYLHSSGSEHGRNGMAWDSVLARDDDDDIARFYRQHICRVGRVTRSLRFPAVAVNS